MEMVSNNQLVALLRSGTAWCIMGADVGDDSKRQTSSNKVYHLIKISPNFGFGQILDVSIAVNL